MKEDAPLYIYKCMKCLHRWKSKKFYITCPRCKTKDIDAYEDIGLIEEEDYANI
ncbi:MAG: hypothetical protein WC097_00645 [Eubacteriales bacterium]